MSQFVNLIIFKDGSQEEDYEDVSLYVLIQTWVLKIDFYLKEPDETLYERLWGLTEMFPEPVRNLTDTVVDLSGKSVFTLYKFFCASSWIFFTSSMVLFAPIIFETERAQMEEMQKSQQKQILLGSAPGPGGMPPIPR